MFLEAFYDYFPEIQNDLDNDIRKYDYEIQQKILKNKPIYRNQ